MSGGWLYLAVASLHLPGIALLVFLLRNLAETDPPDAADDRGPGGGGPPRGWRWRRRPRTGDGARVRRAGAVRRAG
jgi:hypothetical protein